MRKNLIRFLLLSAATALGGGACKDDAPKGQSNVDTPDGGDDGSAPKLDAGPSGLAAPAPKGLAVVTSDYTSTSISLLDGTGTLVHDACVDSMTGAQGQLSFTLSGDVTVPSQPQRGNELWVIDRGNSALTVVDPATCAVKRQLSVSTGFKSNPHDVVVLSDSKAYVTRFAKNLAPASANGGGDDVLIIDPQSGAISGRIDLGPYATTVPGATLQARPDRALIAAGRVLVTLASQDALLATTGDGRVVIVDPAADRVAGVVDLPGLKSCGAIDLLPGSSTVYVSCGGVFGDVDQALQSAVVLIDVGADPPVVSRIISSEIFGSRALNSFWVVALTPTRAFAGTFGAFADATTGAPAIPDGLFAFDPTTGAATQLAMAAAFDLGRAAGGGGRLFLPDATDGAPRVHVFDGAAGATPVESVAFDPDPAHELAPREVAWY